MLPAIPVIAFGIAALAALFGTSGCGGDESQNDAFGKHPNDGSGGSSGTGGTRDAGTGGSSATGGRGGSSGSNSSGGSSATGSGGTVGDGGMAGDGGTAGIGDAGGGMDAGGMGGEGGTPDAGNPIQVPYHFGMIYGSPVKALRGTGSLLFSNQEPCQLLGGNFAAEYPTGGGSPFQMTVNLMPNQSINFCSGTVTLPLAGGVFQGVNWLLTNRSNPLTSKQSWEITACSPETAGGAEKCSGALELTTP